MFGFHLHEQASVVIGSSDVYDSFIGFIYSLVGMVLMDHLVNSDGSLEGTRGGLNQRNHI